MRFDRAGDISHLLRHQLELTIGSHEYMLRSWAAQYRYELTLPVGKVTPTTFLLMVYAALQRSRQVATELLELMKLRVQFICTATMVSKNGKDLPKHLESAEYLYYLWQKQLNPAAVRPFSKQASKLEEDYERLKHIFDAPEGIKLM